MNVSGSITVGPTGNGPLDGPVALWIDRLTGWALDLRIDAFVVWPPDSGTTMIEQFAGEILPAVHEATKQRS